MNLKNKASSEIFATFTLNKIDPKIKATMSEEQLNAFYDALLATEDSKKHNIDIRGTIPLYFAKYYFVFFAGRDKRRQTLLEENLRHNKGNAKTGLTLVIAGGLLLLFFALLFAGYATYLLKSEAGIDLNPGKHLQEILKEWFIN